MKDFCDPCKVKGDMYLCKNTDCDHHNSWYAKCQQDEMERLRHNLEVARSEKNKLLEENKIIRKELQKHSLDTITIAKLRTTNINLACELNKLGKTIRENEQEV